MDINPKFCLIFGLFFSMKRPYEAFEFPPNNSSALIQAIDNIMDRFDSRYMSNIFIMEQSSLSTTKNLNPNDVVNEFLRIRNTDRRMMSFIIENCPGNRIQDTARFFNIFIIDSYEGFRHIFTAMTAVAYDYSGFFMIALTEFSDNFEETITRIFRDCWSLHISNVNVLTPTDDPDTVLLFTFFPFTPQYCEHIEPVISDYFENGTFVFNAPLFPQKYENFYNCPLTVSTYTAVPNMIVKRLPDGTYYPDGIGGILLRVMAQRLNFKPIVMLSSFNMVQTNGSDSKLMRQKLRQPLDMVGDGDANFTIGSLTPATARAAHFSWSNTYLYGYVVYAIPIGKPYTSLERLLFPFSRNVWLCFCTVFFAAVVLMSVSKLTSRKYRDFVIGPSNSMPFFNLINVCLGGSVTVNDTPTKNFARTLFLLWLLSTLVLRNAYQGKLFDNLRSSYRKAPLFYIDQLYKSNVKLYLPEGYLQGFADNFPEFKRRLHAYNKSNLDVLYNLTDDHFGGAYIGSSLRVHVINPRKVTVLKTKDYVRSTAFCMYFRKHSSLINPFNREINSFTSSGLINHWSKRFSKVARSESGRSEPKPISLKQVAGIINMCGCLFGISLIVFILELFSTKFSMVKISLDFLMYGVSENDVQYKHGIEFGYRK